MERPEFYRTKMRYFGDGVENSSGFTSLCVAIIISGVSGFAISYGSTWCVRVTSSTTYSMVGALNKLPIAIAGMLFFEDGKVTVANVSSVFIAFFGGLVYTYAKNRQKAESAKILPVTKQDVEYSKVQLDENPELKA
ncbi:GDP-mannose transporter into the lumen of the Golgi [Nowakowskiella sp. JEL0407]|nr:GDP-mannose transporter into the lumen of the Golgi [Nowakowskiella sp. JEL0407]